MTSRYTTHHPSRRETSFTIELGKEESDKLSRMLWLDKMEWLTHQLNTVWKNKFFKT